MRHSVLWLAGMTVVLTVLPVEEATHVFDDVTRAPPTHDVVNVYPHDAIAFTQGLAYANGVLYEGTGLYGRSSIRKLDLRTGAVIHERELDPSHFGEGITIWRDKIFQLTYQDELGFIYDAHTLERVGTFSYRGEGWGLTHDGTRLIMSDGSATLRFLDPESVQEIGRLTVMDQGVALGFLNELEFVRGEILANVWPTSRIARIAPATGEVKGWIDLTELVERVREARADVLNGIAYDEICDRLFVTGKWWPYLFEIRILPLHVDL